MMGSRLFSWALSRPGLGRRLLRQTMGRDVDPVALEANRRMFAATPAAVRAACFAATRGMDLRSGLGAVRIPTVVLAGEADSVVNPKLGRVVARGLPEARFELLAGAGHMLPLEAPDRVAEIIAELAADRSGHR
jgi:pimeloyl-ACP methyl ester carboxylesterase